MESAGYAGLGGSYTTLNPETLATLIVKECVAGILNTDLEDVEGGDAAVLAAAAYQIEDHFGLI